MREAESEGEAFRKSGAFRAGHRSGVNSQDNLIFNHPPSLVTQNPTIPCG